MGCYLEFQSLLKLSVGDSLCLKLLSPHPLSLLQDVLPLQAVLLLGLQVKAESLQSSYFLIFTLDFCHKFFDFLILEMDFIFQKLKENK